ncbi:MAG: DUF2314 domain-containing protein [Bryobacteraceae bacterium]|nr:DUF2314 domain-containing protein [Bryobacteraceae bacterium]
MSLMNLMNKVLGFQANPEKPLISLVLLLDRPRELHDDKVQHAVWEAWRRHYGPADEASTVVGEQPTYVVSSRDRSFVVNSYSTPYVKDVQRAAKSIEPDLVRQAFLRHKAWISVDLLRPQIPEGKEFVECMGLLGKLAAELIDEDCVALTSPHTNQTQVCSPAIREKLLGTNPFDAFREPVKPAVKSAVPDAPLQPPPSVAEAQRRWPEFMQAFGSRKSGQLFSVRANVTDGRRQEMVWIRVQTIRGADISGLIDNHPARLTELKQGDRVSAKAGEVSDWMYVDRGNLVGGFTERLIAGHS